MWPHVLLNARPPPACASAGPGLPRPRMEPTRWRQPLDARRAAQPKGTRPVKGRPRLPLGREFRVLLPATTRLAPFDERQLRRVDHPERCAQPTRARAYCVGARTFCGGTWTATTLEWRASPARQVRRVRRCVGSARAAVRDTPLTRASRSKRSPVRPRRGARSASAHRATPRVIRCVVAALGRGRSFDRRSASTSHAARPVAGHRAIPRLSLRYVLGKRARRCGRGAFHRAHRALGRGRPESGTTAVAGRNAARPVHALCTAFQRVAAICTALSGAARPGGSRAS